MFDILAEIGEPGDGALTGQYPPLREILEVDPEEVEQARLRYLGSIAGDKTGSYTACLLVQVGPSIIAEVVCTTYLFGKDKADKA